jgi:2-polyprenyl-3-methyl-5-hydroxy-6-metoxy-1,4-benzoquinol methylase
MAIILSDNSLMQSADRKIQNDKLKCACYEKYGKYQGHKYQEGVLMEFIGEGITPEVRFTYRELFLWHMARYDYAKKHILPSNRVLDVACGTGYGTYELGMFCREIRGIDISGEAIEYARRNYNAHNISWQEYDCTKMTNILPASSFDVVVSFETIEHLDRQSQFVFVDQISKVLHKDGIAIISTPNVDVYGSPAVEGPGPKHKYEMNKQEFLDTLKTRFDQVYLLGQAFSDTSKNRWRSMKMACIINGLFKLNFRPLIRDYGDYMDKSDLEFSIYNFERALMFLAICKFPQKE